MSAFHRNRRRGRTARLLSAVAALAGLTGLAGVLLSVATSPAAQAMRLPAGGATRPMPPSIPVRTVVVGGMPGWQITAIALGAALAAAITVVLAGHARSVRRRLPATTA